MRQPIYLSIVIRFPSLVRKQQFQISTVGFDLKLNLATLLFSLYVWRDKKYNFLLDLLYKFSIICIYKTVSWLTAINAQLKPLDESGWNLAYR
jgi:hypothetical protein